MFRKKEKERKSFFLWVEFKCMLAFYNIFVILAMLEYIFIASYYRQLSADKKMKKFKIKTSFVSRKGTKARADKTGINFMIFILIFVENCL